MFLAAGVGGFNVGDILFSVFSIVAIIVMIVLIIFIVRSVFRGNNRNKDLTRIEEKLDILLKEKDKL